MSAFSFYIYKKNTNIMAKVLMTRTVFDGKVYHKAGEKVNVSGPTLEKYISKKWCELLPEKIEVETESELELPKSIDVIETKEKKFKSNKKK